jgi:branched-chain amino acid transport system substrate-binding protein
MRSVWTQLMLILTVCTVLVLASCKQEDNDEADAGVVDDKVRIGLFVSTSGDFGTYGQDTRAAVNLAMDEINAAGGVLGKQIEIVFHDTRSLPEQGGQAATHLVSRDNVLVGIGAVASSVSLQAAPVFQNAGVPMVSPSSTNPAVTQDRDFVFRICYLDPFQGGAMAVFAYNELEARRVAMIVKRDDDYSTGLADFFQRKFESLNGTVVRVNFSRETGSDFSSQVTAIQNANADVLFAPVYYNDMSVIARQIRTAGLDIQMLGGDGWESELLLTGADGALEGGIFGTHYNPFDEAEKTQAFVEAYRELHDKRPSGLAALGYDAVYVVAEAIERAGEFNRAKVAEALRATRDFEGVTGTFSIDANRNARKPISILRIEGDRFVPIRQITPAEVE